jgi:hypothetical protein
LVLSILLSILDGSFILAYEQVPANYRNYSGILCGIMWQLGLMFGTFAAIPLHYIVNPDL